MKKLFLSAENLLAKIDQGLAKDSQRNEIYATHNIKKNIAKEEFLIDLATEIDLLEILVHFTRQTEFNDLDTSTYLEEIDDVRRDVNALLRKPGKHFRKIKEELFRETYWNSISSI